MPKITKRFVDSIRPDPERESIHWDDDVKGFGLKVSKSGRKVFLLFYRTRDGRQRKPTIGTHGAVTADEARKVARSWLAEVVRGGDPGGDRLEKRAALTVAELAEKYLERSRKRIRPTSYDREEALLRLHILPALGSHRLPTISRRDVAKLHAAMTDAGQAVNANRAVALLHRMFEHAMESGHMQGPNPAAGVRKNREEGRERFLSPDEMARLGAAIEGVLAWRDEVGETQREKPFRATVDAVKLLALTGCRRREITNLRWTDIDFDAGRIRLEKTKTKPRRVHLSSAAVRVLQGIRAGQLDRGERTDFVCPSPADKNKPLSDLKKGWRWLCAAADIEGATIHDLRHSYASSAIGSGVSLHITGGLLGHARSSTTERYAHLGNDPLRVAAESVGSAVAAALAGGAMVIDLAESEARDEATGAG